MRSVILHVGEGKATTYADLKRRFGEVRDLDLVIDRLLKLDALVKERGVEKTGSTSWSYKLNEAWNMLETQVINRINVSGSGNMGTSVRIEGISLKDGLRERSAGFNRWEDRHAPKVRFIDVRRSNKNGLGVWKINSKKYSDKSTVDFHLRLNFDPPLSLGEWVRYGFYVWSTEHYPMTRQEAMKRYGDEWIYEGFGVTEPTLFMDIRLNFPKGYVFAEPKAARFLILSPHGPRNSAPIKSKHVFERKESHLRLRVEDPEKQPHFVCWLPEN